MDEDDFAKKPKSGKMRKTAIGKVKLGAVVLSDEDKENVVDAGVKFQPGGGYDEDVDDAEELPGGGGKKDGKMRKTAIGKVKLGAVILSDEEEDEEAGDPPPPPPATPGETTQGFSASSKPSSKRTAATQTVGHGYAVTK